MVWIVSHGRLKRCSPWQLRHATPSERILAEQVEAPTPVWTFHSLLQGLEKGEYDTYDDLILTEDLRPRPAGGAPRRGRSRSRTPGTRGPREPEDRPAGGGDAAEASGVSIGPPDEPVRKAHKLRVGSPINTEATLKDLLENPRAVLPPGASSAAASSTTGRGRRELEENPQFVAQKKRREDEEKVLFHVPEEREPVCEIGIPLPESDKEWQVFTRVPACYAVQQVRKAEVKWSTLDADGRAKFDKAKHAEIDQWLAEEAVKAVEGHIPQDRVMRMRWVLTYKDTGAAKARLVLIGFEDPDLDRLVSSSPTMCRRTRQLVLQAAVQQGWKPLKGDIKSAFLQGTASQTLRQVYALPVPELAQALGVPSKDERCRSRRRATDWSTPPRSFTGRSTST